MGSVGDVNPDLLIIKRVDDLTVESNPKEILASNVDGVLVKTKYADLKSLIVSSVKGEATPSSSPTPWAPGDADIFEKWDVKTEGTYTNFKDSSNTSIVVTADDLKNNFIQIWVTNGVSEKVLSEKPIKGVTDNFEPENNVDPQGGKQINDYYTKKTIIKSRNLINEAVVDFSHYYQTGTKTLVPNDGLNWVVTDFIPVQEGKTYIFSHETVDLGACIGGYFAATTDTVAIDNITELEPSDAYGKAFVVPTGQSIKFVRIDLNTTDNSHAELAGNYQLEQADYHSPYTPYFEPYEITSLKPEFNSLNRWAGKRIYWFGTSIPAGAPKVSDVNFRYPDIIANRLGAIINNKAVPSSMIRNVKADGSPLPIPLLSFTNEAAAVNYQNSIIEKLNGPDDPDLIILDFGVNDYVADQTDIDNYASFDLTSEDRSKFMGALNFVIKRILQEKPTQRIALVTHFTNASMAIVPSYENLNKAIERVADYWKIPICKTYQKTGWEIKNGINVLSVMCPDTIHPGSMNSDYSVQLLSRIIGDFIEGI